MSEGSIQESSQAKVAMTIAAVLRNKTLEGAAAELNITYRGLRKRIVKWPAIQKAIDSVVGEAADKLKIAAPKAADVIVDSLDDRHLKFEAAKEVLDRVGVGGKSATALKVTAGDMSVEFLSYGSESNPLAVAGDGDKGQSSV